MDVFHISEGPPQRLEIETGHPLADLLGAVLGLTGSTGIDLPNPDGDGAIALLPASPPAQITLANLTLSVLGLRLLPWSQWALQAEVSAQLPPPFQNLALHGTATVFGEGLLLDLAQTGPLRQQILPGVTVALEPGARLTADLVSLTPRLVMSSPVKSFGRVTTPIGSLRLKGLEFSATDGMLATGEALLSFGDQLTVRCAELLLKANDGEVEVRARAQATGQFTQDAMDLEVAAQAFALVLDSDGVQHIALTGAQVAGRMPVLGRLGTAGSLIYDRSAETPTGPPALGPLWTCTVDNIDLPAGLDGLVPRGAATVRVWPDQSILEIDTEADLHLPLLGGLAAATQIRLSDDVMRVTLQGAMSDALSLGPDLPSLTLGPATLTLVFVKLLEGVVENEMGQTLADAEVTIFDRSGNVFGSVTSDENGAFEVRDIPDDISRITVAGRRIIEVSPQSSDQPPRGTFAIDTIDATGVLPIEVPPQFPALSSHAFSATFAWSRSDGMSLAFPDGLPPLAWGPFELLVEGVTAARVHETDGLVTSLGITAQGRLRLPVWDDPVQVSLTGVTAEWREQGFRRLSIESADILLPSALPVLGGARFTGGLAISQAQPGQDALFSGSLGVTLDGASLSVPGLTLSVNGAPQLAVVQAQGETWPTVSLNGGGASLNTAFGALSVEHLSFRHDKLEAVGSLALDIAPAPVTFSAASASLTIQSNGWLADLSVDGFALDLGPLQVSAAQITGRFRHRTDADELHLALNNVDFGPLGVQANATLVVLGTSTGRSVHIEAEMQWQDLPQLPDLHPSFPDFPSTGTVLAHLEWEDTPTGPDIRVVLRGAVEDADLLFAAVPAEVRPEVPSFAFTLSARLDAGDLSASSVSAEMDVSLPDLTALSAATGIAVDTGGPDGLVRARLDAGFETPPDGGADAAYLRLSLENAIQLGLSLPGMPQETPTLDVSIDHVSFDLGAGGVDPSLAAGFKAAGHFVFRPPDPPPFVPLGHHMRQLLDSTGLSTIEGTIALDLTLGPEGPALEATGTMVGAEIEVNVFELLSNLTRSMGPPAEPSTSDTTLSLEAGFKLEEIGFRFGPAASDPSAGAGFEIHMGFGFHLGDASASAVLRLSDRELSLLLDDMQIPLGVPIFPLLPEDLDGLVAEADWTNRRAGMLPEQMAIFDVLHRYWTQVRPERRPAFLDNAQFMVREMRQVTQALQTESRIALRLTDVGVVFPFADPSALRVQGGAQLVNFRPDDPLAPLGHLEFLLGLSADRIFFALKTQSKIDLPAFGRYPGGSVDVSQFSIGYGYTRNSLAVNIAGKVVVPQQLIEDADTSSSWGVGIRLPRHNRLGFRLDLIPVSIGPVNFVLPVLEFEADLRAPGSPPYADLATCTPHWDGLQIIAPGPMRANLKHIAFSPFFTFVPAPNLRLDWDLALGDDTQGLRIIANDFLYFGGVSSSSGAVTVVPFLASPFEPYFENLCVHLSFAGFGLHFNLERPFPSMNPLALFEVLGLLADPQMSVDPNGHLANSVRITLTDGRMTLPDTFASLFAGVPGVAQEAEFTVNLGSLITAVQQVAAAIEPVLEEILLTSGNTQDRFAALQDATLRLDAAALLDLLPPEMRKHRLGCKFGGFEAGAVLLLMSPEAALQEMQRRGDPQPSPPDLAHDVSTAPDTSALAQMDIHPPAGPLSRRAVDRNVNLFEGLEFRSFDASDLSHLPTRPRNKTAAVTLGAHVTLLPGQRLRFLGWLDASGRFALVSSAEQAPLSLSVAGLTARVPLDIKGRLTLEGRTRRYRTQARVTAQASFFWDMLPLPGLAVAQVDQARLALDSSGRFSLSGAGTLALFSGAVTTTGRFDVSETHCLVEGKTSFAFGQWQGTPAVELTLGEKADGPPVRGRIGPHDRFELSGSGTARILGQQVANVSGRITQSGAEMTATLSTLQLGPWPASNVTLELAGLVSFAKGQVSRYRLDGRADLRLGPLELRGHGGIVGDGPKTRVFAEGMALWQGCRWANAQLDLSDSGVKLAGQTSFTVPLTPKQAGPGLELGNLVLKVSLAGQFGLSAEMRSTTRSRRQREVFGLGRARIEGACVLALRLPSSDDQVLPLARQSFAATLSVSAGVPLLQLNDIDLLPFQAEQISVTIPKINIDAVNPLTFTLSAKTTDDAAPLAKLLFGNFLEASAGSGSMSFPFAPAPGSSETTHQSAGISVPKVSVTEGETLSLLRKLKTPFSVALVWMNDALTLQVQSSGQIMFEASLDTLLDTPEHLADLLDG